MGLGSVTVCPHDSLSHYDPHRSTGWAHSVLWTQPCWWALHEWAQQVQTKALCAPLAMQNLYQRVSAHSWSLTLRRQGVSALCVPLQPWAATEGDVVQLQHTCTTSACWQGLQHHLPKAVCTVLVTAGKLEAQTVQDGILWSIPAQILDQEALRSFYKC